MSIIVSFAAPTTSSIALPIAENTFFTVSPKDVSSSESEFSVGFLVLGIGVGVDDLLDFEVADDDDDEDEDDEDEDDTDDTDSESLLADSEVMSFFVADRLACCDKGLGVEVFDSSSLDESDDESEVSELRFGVITVFVEKSDITTCASVSSC